MDEIIEVYEMAVVYAIGRLHNNCASYPGELPVELQKEYSPFLANHMSNKPQFHRTIISQNMESCVCPCHTES